MPNTLSFQNSVSSAQYSSASPSPRTLGSPSVKNTIRFNRWGVASFLKYSTVRSRAASKFVYPLFKEYTSSTPMLLSTIGARNSVLMYSIKSSLYESPAPRRLLSSGRHTPWLCASVSNEINSISVLVLFKVSLSAMLSNKSWMATIWASRMVLPFPSPLTSPISTSELNVLSYVEYDRSTTNAMFKFSLSK